MLKNIFDSSVPKSGEVFETLYRNDTLEIELITSSDTPDQCIYDQDHDEVVFLISGSATLLIEEKEIELKEGDYLCISAHTRHRVVKTERGCRWLSIRSRKKLC